MKLISSNITPHGAYYAAHFKKIDPLTLHGCSYAPNSSNVDSMSGVSTRGSSEDASTIRPIASQEHKLRFAFAIYDVNKANFCFFSVEQIRAMVNSAEFRFLWVWSSSPPIFLCAKMTTSPETLWFSMGQKLDQISTGRIHLQRRPLCCLSVMEIFGFHFQRLID